MKKKKQLLPIRPLDPLNELPFKQKRKYEF